MKKVCIIKARVIIKLDFLLFQTKDVLEKNFKEKADAVGAQTQAHKIPQMPAPGSKYTPQDVLEVFTMFFKQSFVHKLQNLSKIF